LKRDEKNGPVDRTVLEKRVEDYVGLSPGEKDEGGIKEEE